MFDIGATMVGGIVQTYKANSFVKRRREGLFLIWRLNLYLSP